MSSISITVDYDGTEKQQLEQRIAALFNTPKGTMPMSRGYGLDWDGLDTPFEVAQNRLTIAAAEAVAAYEPDYEVARVEFSGTDDFSNLKATIHIKRRGSYE